MKKILVYFLLSSSILLAQNNSLSPFSEYGIGIYGGINFNSNSSTGSNFFIESSTYILPNVNLNLSIGYSRLYQSVSYNVKTYNKVIIDTSTFFNTDAYTVNEKIYDEFPIALGLKYAIQYEKITPYILLNVNYNFIDSKLSTSPHNIASYNSLNSVPIQYKSNYDIPSVNNFFGAAFGIGLSYSISLNINLDIRYIYNFNKEIPNTNNLVVGIYL